MSGIRVQDPELQHWGMTLPGFVERGRVIASMPSLGLLTLAALTPEEHDVEYHEVRELQEAEQLPAFDLVAISTLTAQAYEAYAIANRYRQQGTVVVIGGLHATAMPDEVLEHADAVVAGEGEPVWPRVLADAEAGELNGLYRPEEDFDLVRAPMPAFERLDIERYNRIPIQTTRGCPWRCSFCASSIMLTPRYKQKPMQKVMAELMRFVRAGRDRLSNWPMTTAS